MKINRTLAAIAIATVPLLMAFDASAAVCAAGVYRAGCAGPNGAVAVRKPAPVYHPAYHPVYHPVYHPPVHCAAGAYHAGCVGPHGAAVIRR